MLSHPVLPPVAALDERAAGLLAGMDLGLCCQLLIIALAYGVYRYQGAPAFFMARLPDSLADRQAAGVHLNRLSGFLLLGLVPAAALCLLGRSPLDYGLGLGDPERVAAIAGFGMLLGVLLVLQQATSPSMLAYYPIIHALRRPGGPLLASALGECLYLCAFEFLWRGYVLFTLTHDLGLAPAPAIVLCGVMCALIHLGKPQREVLGVCVLNLWFGWATLFTGSIWAVVLQRCVAVVVLEWRTARAHQARHAAGQAAAGPAGGIAAMTAGRSERGEDAAASPRA